MNHILSNKIIPSPYSGVATFLHSFDTDLRQIFVLLREQRQHLSRAHLERLVYAIKNELEWRLRQAQIVNKFLF